MKDAGMESSELSAFIYPDNTKIIENGDSLVCFDLDSDPDELSPLAISDERRKDIKDIKGSL